MPSESQTHWRLFCAIELPDALKARVAEHVARLRSTFTHVRASWEKPEKLHITLKFLGDVEVSRVEELARASRRAAEKVCPFELTIEEAGVFPPHGQPRVLWLGIGGDDVRLSSLHQSLEDECAAAGFPRETRAFRPHLTVARLRSPQDARKLAAAHLEAGFEPQTFKASELVLMRSELGRGGSRYDVVSRAPFSVETA